MQGHGTGILDLQQTTMTALTPSLCPPGPPSPSTHAHTEAVHCPEGTRAGVPRSPGPQPHMIFLSQEGHHHVPGIQPETQELFWKPPPSWHSSPSPVPGTLLQTPSLQAGPKPSTGWTAQPPPTQGSGLLSGSTLPVLHLAAGGVL